MPIWQIPSGLPAGQGGKAFVDFQNDVTASDIQLAVREGYHSVEHVKRYTTTGMATDQGKTSNINALGILARERNAEIPAVGTTTFRMPYTPTSIGMIAGRDIGGLFDPVRVTPMDKWHREAGAKFEHVGQWMRAWYYPQKGESMEEAVHREVRAARQTAGLLDASTLGKIDIKGPDAAEFLNRIYTNSWLKLGVGNCRYGLMCKDDGMVMDDGVTTRLADDHFHMTTTTGGAAGVLDWLEEWQQTEWPELKVYLTSVTEQWAVATLSGPAAQEILNAAGTDIPLNNEGFRFMSMREGHVSGLPARIYRISFTGELSYEINVPARYGMALWTTLMRAGKTFGITPYGTEAMHVLRGEKGFIIVGQETDGTVTPHDLGMSWIVSDKKPDFIGKRALARQAMQANVRKQLVGLKTKDPKQVIPEGAHATLDPDQPPPVDMLGHVTSSYFSPNLGHSVAMALLRAGHTRMGQTVYFPMLDGSPPIEATITDTRFYDPKGERLNG
jgi:sarcosine oxidase subunit alpha